MEERKLNFNAPLLSVRRSSTPTTASDRVKGKKIENSRLNRRHTLPLYKCDFGLDQVTEPVAVPFKWEQVPGRPKGGSKPEARGVEEASVIPRIPAKKVLDAVKSHVEKKLEERIVDRPQIAANSFSNNVTELDSLKEGLNVKAGIDLDDDANDVYSDALDTLSPTDSFSMNCSVSGLSGTDDLVVKPSGTFTTDPQTREFMMSRFLPAAKAMTLEPNHYASRKQLVAVEQPRLVANVVNVDRTPHVNRHELITIPHSGQDVEEEESEDEYDEHDASGKVSTKACGLLPRLCLKNSLCILNPVPGMKIRTQASKASKHEIEKSSKAAFSRSQSPMKKLSRDAVYKDSGIHSPRLLAVENKLACGSSRFTYVSDHQVMSRTSPFRHSRGISPYRNERPQSPFRGGGFLGIPKEAENFKANRLNLSSSNKSQELLSCRGTKGVSRPVSPTIEKTLYVDTVNTRNMSCSNSGSSDIKECLDSAGKDFRDMEGRATAQASFQDAKCPNILKDGKLEHEILESTDTDISLPSDMMEDLCQESKALVCISATADENLNNCDQLSEKDVPGNVKVRSGQSPVPPVLPKTPSESWLWRTLPAVPSQNPFSRLYRGTSFQSKLLDSKTPSTTTKWETMVKSSYLHHDHVRYSEELIPVASQQSKS